MISILPERLSAIIAACIFFVLSQNTFCATNATDTSQQWGNRSAQIFETCTHAGRMTTAEIAIVNNHVSALVTCVNDHTGQVTQEKKSGSRIFPVRDAQLQSVYFIEAVATFDVKVLINSTGQTAEIKHSDGRPCVVISAAAKSKNPVPRFFTSSSNDWRSAIDYMIDKNCSALAIRLGNNLAITPISSVESLDLYNISFKTISR